MIGKDLSRYLLFGLFLVPTGEMKDWIRVNYNKIPPNQFASDGKSIEVKVKDSASPLVFKLPKVMRIRKLSAEVSVTGGLNEGAQSKDKGRFPEDSVLRIGVVARGERTLNWIQRQIAANWVLQLFELAPEGVGLDRIYFYNIASDAALVGRRREHPKSDLIVEEIVGVQQSGITKLEKTFDSPKEAVALWVSVDGDDTRSTFSTRIHSILIDYDTSL